MIYYHVIIETPEVGKRKQENKKYVEVDKTDLTKIKDKILRPYLRGEEFHFDGCLLKKSNIKRIKIKKTEKTTQELADAANNRASPYTLHIFSPKEIIAHDDMREASDITSDVFEDLESEITSSELLSKKPIKEAAIKDLKKVFIVHGRDNSVKQEVARFIQQLGFSPIILHEQPNSGRHLFEKIENYCNVGFAIVLYTPCDQGGLSGSVMNPRARQNVVFEHGYLIAKLGRERVCALLKQGVEIPSDIDGIVYISLDDGGAWKIDVAKELDTAGYEFDFNRVVKHPVGA